MIHSVITAPLLFCVVVALTTTIAFCLRRLRDLDAASAAPPLPGPVPDTASDMPVGAGSASSAAAGLLRLGGRRGLRSRRRRELIQLAGVVARSLRSGATLAHAWIEASDHPAVGSFHQDLAVVVETWRRGEPLADALAKWNHQSEVEGLDLLVTALTLGIETGGDRAQVLDRVAATLGDRLALEDEVRALTSQARASAGLITLAPVVLAAVFLMIDPSVVQIMVGTFVGRVALVSGVLLGVANWWWMSVIVRRTLS